MFNRTKTALQALQKGIPRNIPEKSWAGSQLQFIPQSPQHVAALPALPSRPEHSPAPWLSPSEMETYLYPLRNLTPWTFRPWRYANKMRTIMLSSNPSQEFLGNGLVLAATYGFTARAGAASFVSQTKKIAEEENHLPLSLNILPQQKDKSIHLVHTKIITHEAFMPKSISDFRRQLVPHHTVKDLPPVPENLKVPGLTLRDIRFALLVDQMFRNEFFISSSSSTDLSITGINSHVPSSDHGHENALRDLFRRGFCPCCRLPHRLEECSLRKEYPPPQGCKNCEGKDHWAMDCPEGNGSGGSHTE